MNSKLENNTVKQNSVIEISFHSKTDYENPFEQIDVDVVFHEPTGKEVIVPAFWAGDNTWKVRYSSNIIGKHKFVTSCSDKNNKGLNGMEGAVIISKYSGNNNLLKHGPIKASSDFRHLEHEDGTPFFWLGDTWWFGFTDRLGWPTEFKNLVKDRKDKGFTILHIIAGLFPDTENMHSPECAFDPAGANEGGFSWEKDFKSINPKYFDFADRKIQHLIESEIVPCIFGAWGFYILHLGIEKMKKHWRYLIARWGAYPVIWCAAGEAKLVFLKDINVLEFDNPKLQEANKKAKDGWNAVAKYIRFIDPYKRLLTVHPSPGDLSYSSRDILDNNLFDIDMLQTGHWDRSSYFETFKTLRESLENTPKKPVINGECNYEGIMGGNYPDIIRFLFWTHILCGAAGHSYGAWGLTSLFMENEQDNLISRSIQKWGTYHWKKAAYEFPGSYQIGLGKKFLEKFEWHKFEPHQEWISPHSTKDDVCLPYAAGIPGKIIVIYIPPLYYRSFRNDMKDFLTYQKIKIMGLEKNVNYIAHYFNPRTGNTTKQIEIKADNNGIYIFEGDPTAAPTMDDWVLVLDAKS